MRSKASTLFFAVIALFALPMLFPLWSGFLASSRALLHKSAVGQDMPNPKWIYAAATVWGVPSAVN